MTRLEHEALTALRAVIRGTTRPMGQDSTGAAYCHIREASLAAAQTALARLEEAAQQESRP